MFQKMKHSLIARVVGLSAIGTVLATLAVMWAVFWVFERSLDTQLDNHLTTYTDMLAGAIHVEGDTITVDQNNTLLKSIPRHWQIDTKETHIARSPLLNSWLPLEKTISFEPKRRRFIDEVSDPLVTVRQAFRFPEGTVIIITFGLEEHIAEAYQTQIKKQFHKNVYKALLVVVFVLGVIGMAQALVITNPLRKIRTALQDVQMGQKNRIAEDQLPAEAQILTKEVNNLLDYVDGVIKRHRTFSSNLAHTLKTPLTVIRGETESPVIQEQIDDMLRVIDRNLSKAQTAGTTNILSARTEIKPVIERICDGFTKIYPKDFEIQCPKDAIFYGDESDLFEMLGNLIENACKYGKSKIQITVSDKEIVIEDDGTGIPETEYKAVLERGLRMDETKSGSGLGLSITKDIIELYGGALTLGQSKIGGLKTTIQLSKTS